MAKAKTKKRNKKGWLIALAVIALIVISVLISIEIGTYSPKENYYGNGTTWSATENFDNYYQNMLTLPIEFDGSRPLRIMQIADPQLKFGSWTHDKRTMDLLDKAIDQLKPDVAVVTGDLTFSMFAKTAVKHFADFMEKKQVYWTYAYGNHDSEMTFSKYRHAELLAKYKYCLFDGGPSNIMGESNYFVNVKDGSGNLVYSLCMMDSNMYQEGQTDVFNREYGEIEQDQANWYKWVIQGLQTKNPAVQSSLFMHIPFKAHLEVLNDPNKAGSIQEVDREWKGETLPGIAFQGGSCGQVMYDTMVALGSTKGVFVGHDHINTIRGLTEKGIFMAYGRCCGYHTYPFFNTEGEHPLLEKIIGALWGYEGPAMYLDQWDEENGNDLGKGVSMIEINVDTSSADYGQIYMYDVNHQSLTDGTIQKQHEYTAH
ncbi:MAG: metallophosphoesterase [Clostridia bacterium]|nr:metallophosphoesterase [Clostridia bacterium]